jgi:predicted deacylase
MKRESIPLPRLAPGLEPHLSIWRFGKDGAGPRIYIQGGLHADEAPGTLVAHRLIGHLKKLPSADILGMITIIPVANPIGLSQRLLGTLVGRFALEDGRNFNRGYKDCGPGAIAHLEGRLGTDSSDNTCALRAALTSIASNDTPTQPIPALKAALLREAIGADYALDLHCDTEAVPHAYVHPDCLEALLPLFRLLGVRALLSAEISGDHPFDEAVSGPWGTIQAHFSAFPFETGGHATTIELRGQTETEPQVIEQDSTAILAFLRHVGAIAGQKPTLPPALAMPTPLAGCSLIPAPASGALSWHCALGSTVKTGDLLAEIIDAHCDTTHPVLAECDGLLFARTNLRQVAAGAKLGKIAGYVPLRSGQLLGP